MEKINIGIKQFQYIDNVDDFKMKTAEVWSNYEDKFKLGVSDKMDYKYDGLIFTPANTFVNQRGYFYDQFNNKVGRNWRYI